MNPHQKNKVDISSLSPDEQRLFRLYGKLPNKKDLLQNKLKERKYFDSGDYALSKAGKASDVGVTSIGREHPVPENIPHSSLSQSPTGGSGNGHRDSIAGSLSGEGGFNLQHRAGSISGPSGSPVKESSFLHRATSVDDQSDETEAEKKLSDDLSAASVSPPPRREGMPIRRA